MVSARATLTNPRVTPSVSSVNPRELRRGIYIGRTLIPPEHDKARVCLLNTTKRQQLITKGICLGNLQAVQVFDDSNVDVGDSADGDVMISAPTAAALRRQEMSLSFLLMDRLPDELNGEQRAAARRLLHSYEDIFSKNEYDVGRTPLVEYHIDTGNSRPIRQALRQQPLKHLDAIDENVKAMLEHGIIEPAASPWASRKMVQ
jgi:hypothetical protein